MRAVETARQSGSYGDIMRGVLLDHNIESMFKDSPEMKQETSSDSALAGVACRTNSQQSFVINSLRKQRG